MRERGKTVKEQTIPSATEWKEVRFGLTFRFGFITLATARFTGLMPSAYFTQLPSHPYLTPLPRNVRNKVFVLRSHPVDAPLPRFQFRDGLLWYVPGNYKRMYANLTGSFEDYLKGIPPKRRKALQRTVRNLFAEFPGRVTFRCYRSPEELLEFHPRARTVSVKTYQERLLKSGLPDTTEFKAEMRDLACRDSVRAFLLFVDEKPIAYLCCPAEGLVLLYGHLGYDTIYSKYSPGSVLQYLAFEELFRENRFGIFDFEEGEGQHKRLFSTHEIECADLYVFPCRLTTIALVLLHAALGLFSRTALFLAARVGIKRKIKAAVKKWMALKK
jgi:hypothetical protein